MTSFKITSNAGIDLGTFEAETAEAALDAMARDAGYANAVEAARTLGADVQSLDDLCDAEGVEGGWTTDGFRFRGGRINLFVEEVEGAY